MISTVRSSHFLALIKSEVESDQSFRGHHTDLSD